MSAADAREELEAAIWRRVHDSAARPTGLTRQGMTEILDAADAYAEAVADERITGRTLGRTLGRGRLAEAVAEIARRAS